MHAAGHLKTRVQISFPAAQEIVERGALADIFFEGNPQGKKGAAERPAFAVGAKVCFPCDDSCRSSLATPWILGAFALSGRVQVEIKAHFLRELAKKVQTVYLPLKWSYQKVCCPGTQEA